MTLKLYIYNNGKNLAFSHISFKVILKLNYFYVFSILTEGSCNEEPGISSFLLKIKIVRQYKEMLLSDHNFTDMKKKQFLRHYYQNSSLVKAFQTTMSFRN